MVRSEPKTWSMLDACKLDASPPLSLPPLFNTTNAHLVQLVQLVQLIQSSCFAVRLQPRQDLLYTAKLGNTAGLHLHTPTLTHTHIHILEAMSNRLQDITTTMSLFELEADLDVVDLVRFMFVAAAGGVSSSHCIIFHPA